MGLNRQQTSRCYASHSESQAGGALLSGETRDQIHHSLKHVLTHFSTTEAFDRRLEAEVASSAWAEAVSLPLI